MQLKQSRKIDLNIKIDNYTNIEKSVPASSLHTFDLIFHRCQWMEDAKSMNKVIKLYDTIFLLVKQIKNLYHGDNLSFISLFKEPSCNAKCFDDNQEKIKYVMVNISRN
jgi:hypothetical protein